jgi:trimeric autotransporter adhesin
VGVNGTGNGFADFLLGLPFNASTTWGDTRYYRQLGYSAWANDDYRFLSNLSLSLGVRYEYTSPIDEKYGRLANLEFAPGFSDVAALVTSSPVASCPSLAVGVPCLLAGAAGVPGGLVNAQHGAVEPRIGLAWQASRRGNLVIRAGYGTYYNQGIYNQISSRLGQQPQFINASGNLQTSNANPLSLAAALTQVAPNTLISNTYAYDPNMKLPFTQTWNLQIQRNMPGNLVLQINYVGVKATHLTQGFDPNQAAPGPAGNAASRLPISYAGLLTYLQSGANLYSNTESVSVIRRMRSNVSFQFQYQLAKSIDDTAQTALNPLDLAAEYANSPGIRRNQVNFTMILESPVDQRRGFLANHGFLTKALKDWTLQTPVQWGSGAPLTATVFGDVAGIGTTATQRAQATGEPVTNGTGFFNLGAFTTPASGTFGNAGRDTIPGPDIFSFNMNMSRVFQIKERKNLEIQINSTNILNHPVPTAFGTVVNQRTTYGVLSNVNGMRVISGTIRFRM